MGSTLARAYSVYKPFVMQIGLDLHQIAAPLVIFAYFWVRIQSLGVLKSSLRLHALLLKQSIAAWLNCGRTHLALLSSSWSWHPFSIHPGHLVWQRQCNCSCLQPHFSRLNQAHWNSLSLCSRKSCTQTTWCSICFFIGSGGLSSHCVRESQRKLRLQHAQLEGGW